MTCLQFLSIVLYLLNSLILFLCSRTSSTIAVAIDSSVMILGCIPGLTGLINGAVQCVLKIEGYDVKARYPNVPHPNAHGTDKERELI